MIENPVADAWRAAVAEMGLPFAAPFRFTDNRGKERQCTGLLPHIGSPMGTLMSTKYDPECENFIECVRGLGYYPVILNSPVYETYNPDKFVGFLKDWGWYGSTDSIPAFFVEDDGAPQE
jgi:hypothetical protein